ncbi:ExeM/NucH family extracellular endonuclease [Marinibactrum halimedae]|uniref:Nuclease n=1 Tax=Marinibactrum halimedae TaxID=1444977 RepID=A0AA37T8Y9_9GAMM|nr:ExeM/NucH family extracellular endonuclease [Marinibactrum halimedae]MCD9457804.1 ExeM/NucH family extracellular endonuclease [Marinibactrum halimedae]GLS24822.1 nuclease [Marinibactrum halimedae]
MKKWLWTAPVLLTSMTASADMVISGVFDGTLPGGVPKGVELYVTEDINDLSQYGVGSANNGGGSDGEEFTFPAISVSAGSYIYVTSEDAAFEEFFGFTPDIAYTSSAAAINGDDAIELFKNGSVIDVFGDINVDGSGQSWDHLDGWAYRLSGQNANGGTFDSSHWLFSGTNVWDGASNNEGSTAVMPVATFTLDATPGDGDDDNGNTVVIGTCNDEATLISTIQGAGREVTSTDTVVVEGIVTGIRNNGFFIQEEPSDSDMDSATSEGIFVFGDSSAVAVGEVARVLGAPTEFYGNSQIRSTASLSCGESDENIAAVQIPMPYEGLLDLESIEGMVATVTDATVYSLDDFTKYGEIRVSDSVKYTPSDVGAPLSTSFLEAEQNADTNILVIEDNASGNYPETINFFSTPEFDGLNYDNAPRVGDSVSATGPLNFSFGSYRINPTKESFSILSSRDLVPDLIPGNLSIASFNVLNYFNGEVLDDGSITFDYEENRGARSAEQFELQKARIVRALLDMDADIVGLMEMENDGFGKDSAIRDLVKALNAAAGYKAYRYIWTFNTELTGTDAVFNAIIYKPRVVIPWGRMQSVEMPIQDNDGYLVLSRPSVIQNFLHKSSGNKVAVAVSHLRSKRPRCIEDNMPTDIESAQGGCNSYRVSSVVKLGEALESMRLPKNVVLLGDFNAYSKEDPISILTDYDPTTRGYEIMTAANTELDNGEAVAVSKNYGYVNSQDLVEASTYSYYYYDTDQVGSLDHVLLSPSAAERVVDATNWDINASELYQLQYHQALRFNNGANGDAIDFTAIGPYRSSDHNPVIVNLELQSPWRDFFKRWFKK